MAFVLTNTTLTAALQFYLQRTDPSLLVNIPLFVMLAQRRISEDLQITGFKITGKSIPGETLIPGSPYIDKDNAWLVTESFSIGTGANFNTYVPLFHATYEFCQQFNPDPTQTGQPYYYCTTQDENKYFFSPTPDKAYPYLFVAYYTPPLIDTDQNVNFTTSGTPRLLLCACMVEASRGVQQDARIPDWEKMYQDEKTNLSQLELQRIYGVYKQPGGTQHVS